jgi:hypothetical protein
VSRAQDSKIFDDGSLFAIGVAAGVANLTGRIGEHETRCGFDSVRRELGRGCMSKIESALERRRRRLVTNPQNDLGPIRRTRGGGQVIRNSL